MFNKKSVPSKTPLFDQKIRKMRSSWAKSFHLHVAGIAFVTTTLSCISQSHQVLSSGKLLEWSPLPPHYAIALAAIVLGLALLDQDQNSRIKALAPKLMTGANGCVAAFLGAGAAYAVTQCYYGAQLGLHASALQHFVLALCFAQAILLHVLCCAMTFLVRTLREDPDVLEEFRRTNQALEAIRLPVALFLCLGFSLMLIADLQL